MREILLRVRRAMIQDPLQRQLLADEIAYRKYQRAGAPVPPPHAIKAAWVRRVGRDFGIETLIETGTYRGEMVNACLPYFSSIITIELGKELVEAARRRFEGKMNVQVVQGDSGQVLKDILAQVNQPAVFWLDGHYSGGDTVRGDLDCPIVSELDAICRLAHPESKILIDDMRCFVKSGEFIDYPYPEELCSMVTARHPEAAFSCKDDHLFVSLNGVRHTSLVPGSSIVH